MIPRSLQPLRRCVYCGHPLDGGKKQTCRKHKNLPALDPHWSGFNGDPCGCDDCIREWAQGQSEEILRAASTLG